MENFKPRDQQARKSAPHSDPSRFDTDALEEAARTIDQGPNFGTPGDPPDADPDSIEEIEKASEGLDHKDVTPSG